MCVNIEYRLFVICIVIIIYIRIFSVYLSYIYITYIQIDETPSVLVYYRYTFPKTFLDGVRISDLKASRLEFFVHPLNTVSLDGRRRFFRMWICGGYVYLVANYPRLVSGLVHPNYKWIKPTEIPCQSLGLYPTFEPWVVRHQVCKIFGCGVI
jgi:hypothetical protein